MYSLYFQIQTTNHSGALGAPPFFLAKFRRLLYSQFEGGRVENAAVRENTTYAVMAVDSWFRECWMELRLNVVVKLKVDATKSIRDMDKYILTLTPALYTSAEPPIIHNT